MGLSVASEAAFACYSSVCAPPPAGRGGSVRGKGLRAEPLPDVPFGEVKFGYRPRHPDGHPDPGEIVWAHVPFADDPTKGKNRPVLIVGRHENGNLIGVQLTSKLHRNGIPFTWGPGDSKSVIRTDRFIQIDTKNYRKEGAYVKKPAFQKIVDTVARQHGRAKVELSTMSTAVFACYSKACAPPPVGKGGSSGGRVGKSSVSRQYLNDNESVSTSRMGMIHGSPRMVSEGRAKAEAHDWDRTPVTTLPAGAKLIATEKDVKTKYIKRVLDGEPLREGYEPQLVRVGRNTFMVYDGHHRMAMHSALGNRNSDLKVRIAEIPGMPSF